MISYNVTRSTPTTLQFSERHPINAEPIEINVPPACLVKNSLYKTTAHVLNDSTFKIFPQEQCERCPALGNCFGNASRKPFLLRALADNFENLQLDGTGDTLNDLYESETKGSELAGRQANISPEEQACITQNGNFLSIDTDPLKNHCPNCPQMDSCDFRTRLLLLAALKTNQPLPNDINLS